MGSTWREPRDLSEVSAAPTRTTQLSADSTEALAASAFTPAIADIRPHQRLTDIPALVSNGLLALLLAVNVFRTLHHAMWRDELEIFMVSSASSSLWELFSGPLVCAGLAANPRDF
jgi:hypothetical protein